MLNTVPGSTDPPSLPKILDRTPVAGTWISCVKLYVSISTTGSPILGSPTRLNHRTSDKFETPAIFGTLMSVPISDSSFRFSLSLFIGIKPNSLAFYMAAEGFAISSALIFFLIRVP
jgi:hypothetical protein